jgi:hypothetical protein
MDLALLDPSGGRRAWSTRARMRPSQIMPPSAQPSQRSDRVPRNVMCAG